ncbi:MAG: ribulose-phosphate 3-epimerase [Candidatus Pacebacteria bacterium]|nr:ribulose-phosphate 3-epimerase [Candidatus Paceibacterota bacterium]
MNKKNKSYKLAASLVCANILNLESEIKKLEKGNIDYIHFDVMDGNFVPRLGLHPEILRAVKTLTKIPVDVHLMIENPEKFIPDFVEAGGDIIVVHAETTKHLHNAIKMIRDRGAKAGVALNIATPLTVLDYLLNDIDLVMLMAINPGILGHKLIPKTMDKIKELKEKLIDYPDIMIEIDGGVNPESAPEMIKNGANLLVCGTSMIFKPEVSLEKKIQEVRNNIDAKIYAA